MNNYAYKQDYDHYVENLRGYHSNNRTNMRDVYLKSNKQGRSSPQKDFFIEGQMSIRSPKVRNGLAMLNSYQKGQCARLSIPRQKSTERIDADALRASGYGKLPSTFQHDSNNAAFLRKSGQFLQK